MVTKITTLTGTGQDISEFSEDWIETLPVSEYEARQIRIDVLRLDRFHPFISGNKWLKLKHWMEKKERGGYKGILTKGGPWSNHLHACGYACQLSQIPMKAIIKGHPSQKTATIQDLQNWNIELEFTNRSAYYDESLWEEQAQKEGFLYIPMGGEGKEGETGVAEWFSQNIVSCYDYTFCAVGTGTTVTGIAQSSLSTKNLVAVDPGTGDEKLADRLLNLQQKNPEKRIEWVRFQGKFGKITPEIRAVMARWEESYKIPLDFVYTAPLALAMEQMLTTRQIRDGSKVLFVHTGGLQGNRSLSA